MRIVLGWVGAVVVLAGSLVAGVAIANATVFSASGFVRDYLTTLADGRVDEVLALPGVDADGLDERMLNPLAVGAFSWQIVDDVDTGSTHRVTVSFAAHGVQDRATLQVQRIGTRFGLFPEWGFARSPVTALEVATTGDARFTVGELPLEAASGPVVFAALTPGVYVIGHDSRYLTAEAVTVAARGGEASVELEITPTEAFTAAAQAAMEAELTACAGQQVLFPTGCPFGLAVQNRVASTPEWTVSQMPTARLAPLDEAGEWALVGADGVAHLRVEVQSLFDGSVSTLDEDVPFSAGYRVGFDGAELVLAPAVTSRD